jgi:hypothetical protein
VPRVLSAILLLLCACQPAFINGVPNEDSPYFEVPPDSRLVLQRVITLPPHSDRAYFQNGSALPWHDVNIYGSWCVLQLERKYPQASRVEPDAFTVTRVWNERRYYLGRAAAARPVALDLDRGDGQTYEVSATIMHLHAARPSPVSRLVCADWGLPQGGRFLTVSKIRRTLGEWFRLELAPQPR